MADLLTAQDFERAGLGGWQVESDRAVAVFACGSFTAAGELAQRIAALCDEQNHHAEVDIRYPDTVRVTTWSHDAGGLTGRDLELARGVSALYDQLR